MAIGDQTGIVSSARHRVLDERQALLQRILWSRGFEKSARIREFLTYVGTRAFEEPGADIHEQDIGCAVFGRPTEYDTASDNIVRVNASLLRKKLDAYFTSEGAAETLVLSIPKGKYVPVFRERVATASELPAEPTAPPDVSPERPWLRRTLIGLAASAPVLAVLCLVLALRLSHSAPANTFENNPNLNALWSQLIRKEMRTDIVVSDSSLGLLQDLIKRPIPLSEYVHPDQWSQASELNAKPDLQTAARLAAQRQHTSFASVTLASRILGIAGQGRDNISLQFARDFGVRQMKTDNVILLGSKRANPWTELVANQMNFQFGYDGASRQSYFTNRQPRPGEHLTYGNDYDVSYCRIAFLPNLDKTGKILVIAGTEMAGTEAGGEFLTSEKWVSNLRRVVPLDGNGHFPSFEVMLKATKIGGLGSNFEVVAHRIPQL
jgi:hypothetical protein